MNKEELLGFLLDDSIGSQKKCVADEQVYSNWLKNGDDDHCASYARNSQAPAVAPRKKKEKQIESRQEDVDELLNGLEGIFGNAETLDLEVKPKRKTRRARSKSGKGSIQMEEQLVTLEAEDFIDSGAQDANGAGSSPDLDRSKKKEKRRKNTKELSYDELKDKLEITTRKSRLDCKDMRKKIHSLEKRNMQLEQRLEELAIENHTLIQINNSLSKNTTVDEEATKAQKGKEKDRKRRERRTTRRKEERKQEKTKSPAFIPSSTDTNGEPIEF
ncbi:hypothetical protein SKDZ_11G1830 [Saccharomyces kudriavzevii ZP591]|nr:hypothetical protein SKDZ_11G1830 [Saccharomyces kudriavzevii ZP591]